MKTATSEIVIERIVKPISLEPRRRDATAALSPFSIRRTMFSSWTIASSTTNPTESVSPMRERLSRLNPRTAITANVPKSDVGSAIDGMNVERTFRRNRKMTRTTRTTVRRSVSWTSRTLWRIPCERSNMMSIRIAAGICIRKAGRSALTASTTWIVFESGWRWTARTIDRLPWNHAAWRSFSTLSRTFATSPRRTGAPLRHATMSGR